MDQECKRGKLGELSLDFRRLKFGRRPPLDTRGASASSIHCLHVFCRFPFSVLCSLLFASINMQLSKIYLKSINPKLKQSLAGRLNLFGIVSRIGVLYHDDIKRTCKRGGIGDRFGS